MKKKLSNNQKHQKRKNNIFHVFSLPHAAKKWVCGIVIFVIAIIFALSFFEMAGEGGKAMMMVFTFLIGKSVFVLPLILILGGLVFFHTGYDKFLGPSILAIAILLLGMAGILELLDPGQKNGGILGFILTWPTLKIFGDVAAKVIFSGIILAGFSIFWFLSKEGRPKEPAKEDKKEVMEKKPSLLKAIFVPQFKVKDIEPKIKDSVNKTQEEVFDLKPKEIGKVSSEYKLPPLDLLESEKGKPSAGDTVTNSNIIKRTLENFGLKVEMSEINIGPTVTQYTLKPAEGIKLSKITGLSNNLSLALASHPIRIEAPIPGKALVGIEVPNKERCKVRLKDLFSSSPFQTSSANLLLALGRDVSGSPCFADLARMPHLLVAGSTGTGKTIFLNNLILSLLFRNSPESLRLILVDPKRVEFSAYRELPHLLTPVIFDAQKTINVLKWLISEMERRFDVLSGLGSRDIVSYNEKIAKEGEEARLPYIVLIIDELADLMAARGREMEVGIVRLAQMARAVGIHLVLATQRPSVEVITGLIKANVTSRVTFQVASQVDSRTVLDSAGAEKLLGAGDLLFISAEVVKPKRIQGAYVAEKEIKRTLDFIKVQGAKLKQKTEEGIAENHLAQDLERILELDVNNFNGGFNDGDDSLYEDAKRTVIEARKASASLLQRRLRIGYARAARLIDILESKGVVGPGEGAKPREILVKTENALPGDVLDEPTEEVGGDNNNDKNWEKV